VSSSRGGRWTRHTVGYGQWSLGGEDFFPSFGEIGTGFVSYHTFAWRGEGIEDGKVFDITYHVNGFPSSTNPEQPSPVVRFAHYPYSTRFSQPGTLDYIEMLHASATEGWELGSRFRRKIA